MIKNIVVDKKLFSQSSQWVTSQLLCNVIIYIYLEYNNVCFNTAQHNQNNDDIVYDDTHDPACDQCQWYQILAE